MNLCKSLSGYFTFWNTNHFYNVIVAFLSTIIFLPVISCKKLVEVNAPTTSINGDNVYKTDATAISVLTGIYAKLSQSSHYSSKGVSTISIFTGLSADEFTLFQGSNVAVDIAAYKNQLTPLVVAGNDYWSTIYPYVYITNSAIEGITASNSISSEIRQQLLGEAKFLRAFFYFYLVNLYGELPLAISTDYNANSILQRRPINDVYQQIIADLKDAQQLLSTNYLNGELQNTTERTRPNKWAATALLARAYLYIGDWSNAEIQSTSIISDPSFALDTLGGVFLKNSKEAIFQLQPVNSGWNTEDAKVFILSNPPAGVNINHPVFISNQLINGFEAGDNRKTIWTNSYTDITATYYFPYKYKSATNENPITEYLTVLRLGEQYLIRSEARAQQDKISESQDDLNIIRVRAGLTNTTANNKESLLNEILHERRVELFSEWGHRWFDLKRTKNIDMILSQVSSQKGSNWNSYQQLYPISVYELQKNPNLIQTPGY